MHVICEVCNKLYRSQRNLNKHLKNVHKTSPTKFSHNSVYNYKCLESNCNYSFRINKDLVHHLSTKHNFEFLVEELQFKTFYDFKTWKDEIEINENCNYVSPRGRKIIRNGTESHQLLYYICNRSVNNNKSKNKAKPGVQNERKRLTKSQGVSKLKFNCTSQIKVIINDKGEVEMERKKTHYGHKAEIQHLRLGDKTCQVVASQLINGASTSRILDTNRQKIGKTMKRADIMTRQDVFNIKNRFKLDIVEGIKHTNDAISIDLWVQDCKNNREDVVLFYKRQGDKTKNFEDSDFCLVLMTDYQKYMLETFGSNIIAIDSTHGLNSYDFELTTIMVVDEFGEGFPIAFMFTNRKDTEVHKMFFDCVKNKAGIIKTNTFMSDITYVFYNAWVCVMGAAIHQLYCTWHIDRAWQSNLSKITNKEKRTWVYKTLKVLQTELNCESFETHLKVFIEKLLENSDTKNFAVYFINNYSINCRQWAYCYRMQCGINTNMRLESMHRTIKYFYLHKKSVKRLDKGLHAVVTYLRDKVVDRMIKHTKGKYTAHKRNILNRHRVSLTISLTLEALEENKWKVISDDTEYIIERKLSGKCCNLLCEYCNICIHSYTCSCPDFFIKSTICKHIHFFVLKDKNSNTPVEINNQCDITDENIIQCLSSLNKTKSNNSALKEKLSSEISTLHTKLNATDLTSTNQEYLSQALSNLRNASGFLDLASKDETQSSFVDKEKNADCRKYIKKQKKFFSTIKKRKKDNKIKKPNSEDVKNIKNILDGSPLFISTNFMNDHSYC